jgi:hypothetical protein
MLERGEILDGLLSELALASARQKESFLKPLRDVVITSILWHGGLRLEVEVGLQVVGNRVFDAAFNSV